MQMMHILNFARPPLGSNNCKKEGRKENTLKNFKNNLLLSITDEQFYNLSQAVKNVCFLNIESVGPFFGGRNPDIFVTAAAAVCLE